MNLIEKLDKEIIMLKATKEVYTDVCDRIEFNKKFLEDHPKSNAEETKAVIEHWSAIKEIIEGAWWFGE